MSEEHIRSKGGDMPLRYCQATPDLRLPGDPYIQGEDDIAARALVFSCIENFPEGPIWLLSSDDVISQLSADDIDALSENMYEVFDSWSEYWNRDELRENQCVVQLSLKKKSRWMSYDINRFNMLFSNEERFKAALSHLTHAVADVGYDAERKAIPIFLGRGDALLVDNYRMLHARKERFYLFGQWPGRAYTQRWLRMYTGYPEFH